MARSLFKNIRTAGFIGLGIGLIFVILVLFGNILGVRTLPKWGINLLFDTVGLPFLLIEKITRSYGCVTFGCITYVFLLGLVFYFIAGMLVYFIYYFIKKQIKTS